MDTPDLACTLPGPARLDRRREWERVASRATGRTVEDDAVVLTYPPDEGLVEELRRLIESEAECCPGMDFRLTEVRDEGVVEVRIPKDLALRSTAPQQ